MRGPRHEPQAIGRDREGVQCGTEYMLEKFYAVRDCPFWVFGAIKGGVDVCL